MSELLTEQRETSLLEGHESFLAKVLDNDGQPMADEMLKEAKEHAGEFVARSADGKRDIAYAASRLKLEQELERLGISHDDVVIEFITPPDEDKVLSAHESNEITESEKIRWEVSEILRKARASMSIILAAHFAGGRQELPVVRMARSRGVVYVDSAKGILGHQASEGQVYYDDGPPADF